MEAVYKLHKYCGRLGDLEGLFIANKQEVQDLIDSGKTVYFGEVLGKHSDVAVSIQEKDISLVTADDKVIEVIRKFDLENGFNPFDYIEDDEEVNDLNA